MNSVSRLSEDENIMMPRFMEAGDVTLDLFHRDGRVQDKWLHLHPREFALFWRMAESPGEALTRQQLLEDVWRINFDPETNSLAVHISRLRSKLEPFKLDHMVETLPDGGYRLNAPIGPSSFRFSRAPW
ncbi:winged helix-turn-helix domain-containing protein [Erythrobacter sp. HA6-11]